MRTLPFISTCVCDSIGVVPVSPTFFRSIFLHLFNAWQGATRHFRSPCLFFLPLQISPIEIHLRSDQGSKL